MRQLAEEYPNAKIVEMAKPQPPLDAWVDAIARFLNGEQPHLDLPLDIRATAFQLRVWKYLQGIPYGDLQSYTEVAAGIGLPSAVRAVAQACGKNAVALAIPCHRIIRGDGGLGGYRWGLHRKRVLIDMERAHRPAVQNMTLERLITAEIEDELLQNGFSLIPRAVDPAQAVSLRSLYHEDGLFRSHIVMERHAFGKGEYKYFGNPLPPGIRKFARRVIRAAIARRERMDASSWQHAGVSSDAPGVLA